MQKNIKILLFTLAFGGLFIESAVEGDATESLEASAKNAAVEFLEGAVQATKKTAAKAAAGFKDAYLNGESEPSKREPFGAVATGLTQAASAATKGAQVVAGKAAEYATGLSGEGLEGAVETIKGSEADVKDVSFAPQVKATAAKAYKSVVGTFNQGVELDSATQTMSGSGSTAQTMREKIAAFCVAYKYQLAAGAVITAACGVAAYLYFRDSPNEEEAEEEDAELV